MENTVTEAAKLSHSKAFDAEAFADQVDAEAHAWILARYGVGSDSSFSKRNMVTAYRVGYAAGLACARKLQADP